MLLVKSKSDPRSWVKELLHENRRSVFGEDSDTLRIFHLSLSRRLHQRGDRYHRILTVRYGKNGRVYVKKVWLKFRKGLGIAYTLHRDVYNRLPEKRQMFPKPYFCAEYGTGGSMMGMEFIEGASLRNLLLRSAVLCSGNALRKLRETFRKVGAAMRVFHDTAHASGVMLVDELAENVRRVTEGSGYLVQGDGEKIIREVDRAKMRVRSHMQLPLITIHYDCILRNIMITDNGYPYIVDLDSMRAPDNSRWYDVTCFLINLESQIKYWPVVRACILMDMWTHFWQGYSGKELPDGLSESEIWAIIYLIKVQYLFGGIIRPPLFEVYSGVLGSYYVRRLKEAVKRGECFTLSLGGGREDLRCDNA